MRAEYDAVQLVETDDGFSNWGKNINFRPSHTLIVRSISGLQRVVKLAAQEGRKVRVAGFRHSWRCVQSPESGRALIAIVLVVTIIELIPWHFFISGHRP